MGALIQSRGTRRLIRHLNREFNQNIAQYRDNMVVFQDTTVNGVKSRNYLYYVCFGTSTNLGVPATNAALPSTVPPANANHQNLLKRWAFYLQTELTTQNHNRITSAIYSALSDKSCTHIEFDCVEGDFQLALSAFELKTPAGDANDTSTDPNSKYMKIVLMTGPTQAPDPQDSQ